MEKLSSLREQISAEALFGAHLDSYEEGFVGTASGERCRRDATAAVAAFPAGGRNLEWRNPLDFVQQDLFFARGSRVYRVAVVAPGANEANVASRRRGFKLVNALGARLLDNLRSGATENVALS
ncbi:MAG: hypothetical protein ACTHN3_06340 [Solirubrobacterales bacterium]